MGGQPFSYVSQLLKLSKRVNLESSGPVYSFNDHRGGGGYDGQVTVNDLVFESWQAWSCHEEAKESVAQLAVTFLKGLEHQLSKNPAYSGNPSDPFPDVPGVTDKKRTFDDRQQHDIHQDSLKSAASDEDDVRIPKRPFMQRLNDYAQAKRLTLEWEYNRVKNLYHCSVTFQGTRYKSRKRHQRQLDAKEDCAEVVL